MRENDYGFQFQPSHLVPKGESKTMSSEHQNHEKEDVQ